MSGIVRETLTLIITIINIVIIIMDYNNSLIGLAPNFWLMHLKWHIHCTMFEPANEIEWVKRENPNMMQLKIILWLTQQKTSSLYQIYNQDVGIE